MKTSKTWKRWESAMLLALGCFLLLGVWLEGTSTALAGDVLRLHVLANSDAPADQDLKLAVRDRVLSESAAVLSGAATRAEAEARLSSEENLSRLARAGAEAVSEAGYDYPVTVSLETAWFPTREYDGFSLPCGEYRALRVLVGEGAGKNWWCVVFPPLCLGAVTEPLEVQPAFSAETDPEELPEGLEKLVTGDGEGYVLKFKLLELWNQWRQKLDG